MVLRILSPYLGLKFSYNEACIFFETEKLETRRPDICMTFLKRVMSHPQHSALFKKTNNPYNLRGPSRLTFSEYKCNTKRYYTSPLVYLTRLANTLKDKNM